MRRKNEGSTCCGLEAGAVDDLVAQQVLRALEPATLELSLKAIQDVHKERDRLHRHWKHRLERATYEAERAERQYRAVEPENRLVRTAWSDIGSKRCGINAISQRNMIVF